MRRKEMENLMSDASVVGPRLNGRDAQSLRAQIEQVLTDLRLAHHVSEDCWYSCPKSGESCREAAGDVCLCGADMHNAKLDALAAILASPQEPQEPELSVAAVEAWLCEQGLIAKDGPVTKKPGHGSCCTCQDCGFNYDDCECDRNARLVSWRTFLAALSPSPAAAPEQRKEPHEKTTIKGRA